MKRIAIFQSDLRVGGIQKALVNTLEELASPEYEVDLYLFDAGVREDFFALPERDNLHVYRLKPYPFLSRLVYFSLLKRFAPVAVQDSDYDVAIDFSSYRAECAVGALSVRAFAADAILVTNGAALSIHSATLLIGGAQGFRSFFRAVLRAAKAQNRAKPCDIAQEIRQALMHTNEMKR